MSQARALREIASFLGTAEPAVLSISGRWGVGKTHAWDSEIAQLANSGATDRYAYVSAFGMKSIEAIKTAIVQSTVRLDAPKLEPTVDSFLENFGSVDGLRNAAETGARKGVDALSRLMSAIPYAGKLADLMTPGAALLIRNQIICIDDMERAGSGLDVSDILGLVSFLRERRGCRIVLLLNEEGLGEQKGVYRSYLEKAVDQAIRFEPTPEESAIAALPGAGELDAALRSRTMSLGIINIRVIRRIRFFLSKIEKLLADLDAGVADRAVRSIALLGWAVFEPAHAPDIEVIQRFNRMSGLFQKKERSAEELRAQADLAAYGFDAFSGLEAVLLSGLKAGAFDEDALTRELRTLNEQSAKRAARSGIAAPWNLLNDSFSADMSEFVIALVTSVERHARDMNPVDLSEVLKALRSAGADADIPRLVSLYFDEQSDRPREFFETSRHSSVGNLAPDVVAALDERLKGIPLEGDPAEILLRVSATQNWSPEDMAVLASLSPDDYVDLLRRKSGGDLQAIIATALHFGEPRLNLADNVAIANAMRAALRTLAAEGPLNAMRVRRYLNDEEVTQHTDAVAEAGG